VGPGGEKKGNQLPNSGNGAICYLVEEEMNPMRTIVSALGAAVLASCGLFGQTAAPPPAFEVASVKLAAAGERAGMTGGPGTSDPGLFRWSRVTLRNLIGKAYGLRDFQLLGPSFLDRSLHADHYSIVAKVPPGATKDQFNQMLQALLVERFGLVFHHEMKDIAYFELVVAKSGLKMKEAEPPAEAQSAGGAPAVSPGAARGNSATRDPRLSGLPPGRRAMLVGGVPGGGGERLAARMRSIADLVGFLSSQSARPVLDGTGLTGLYDFALDYVPEGGLAATLSGPAIPEAQPGQEAVLQASAPGVPTLSVAIEQQLGLKFEPRKGPFDVFVVDRVDRVPKEN
jgi:uncharacterized protein (TIGR03435 family)